jgi:hypothetical protein
MYQGMAGGCLGGVQTKSRPIRQSHLITRHVNDVKWVCQRIQDRLQQVLPFLGSLLTTSRGHAESILIAHQNRASQKGRIGHYRPVEPIER